MSGLTGLLKQLLTAPLAAAMGGTGYASISAALDATFGSAQGTLLYRGASAWAALGPGTSGQMLQTGGGAANPSWTTPALASGNVSTSGSPASGQIAQFSGANTITGINAVPVSAGGTGGTTAAAARSSLSAAASGSNSDITALPGLAAPIPLVADPAPADGCCRLSVVSTTSLALKPYGGNTLWVGGQACTIPGAGVTLSGPSVAASTLYYVYATASGGTVNALALSTTGHITGSDGREYLSNGAQTPAAVTTSRIVGMVFTTPSGQFIDTITVRYCLNWFNRRGLSLQITVSNASTASPSSVFLGGTNIAFLTWGDEDFAGRLEGWTQNATAGSIGYTDYAIDGAVAGSDQIFQAYAANAYGSAGVSFGQTLTEGVHSATAAVRVNGGAGGTWTLTHTATTRG